MLYFILLHISFHIFAEQILIVDNGCGVAYNALIKQVHYMTGGAASWKSLSAVTPANLFMSGELQTGDPIPSMRALAKSLHISVITVQKAYEDLHRDGFIETTVGRGSFVSAQNKDFFQEEQQRRAEEHLQEAADIAHSGGIPLSKLVEILTMFYQEEG